MRKKSYLFFNLSQQNIYYKTSLLAVLSAILLSLSMLSGCFSMLLDYSREQEIVRGGIKGRIIKDEDQEAINFAKIEIIGRSNIKRSNLAGEFNFSGLDIGTYVLKIEDDTDGDGWPERTGTSIAQISQLAHSGETPFSKDEVHSVGVFLGDISLVGMTSVKGKVQIPSSGSFVSPAEAGYLSRVFITKQKEFKQQDFTEEFNMGAENIAAVDAEGNYNFGAVSSGKLYIIASLHLPAKNGLFGKTVGISHTIPLEAKAGETINVGTITMRDPSVFTIPETTPVAVMLNPAPKDNSYALYTLLGQNIPPCEKEMPSIEDYIGTEFSYVKNIYKIKSTAGNISEYDAPLGLWNMLVCSGGKGAIMSRVAFGQLENLAERPLLGPVHLGTDGNQNCVHSDIVDCNQNGIAALPTYNPLSTANFSQEIAIWQKCAETCGTKLGHSLLGLSCEVDGIKYDCDDDADDQSDTSESPDCHGLGKGTDLDADGICSVVDAFPRCPNNTAAGCPAGVETIAPKLAPGLVGGLVLKPETFDAEYGNKGVLKITENSKVHFLEQVKVPTSLGATFLLGRNTAKNQGEDSEKYYPLLYRVPDSAEAQNNLSENLLDEFLPDNNGNKGIMVNSMAFLPAALSGSQDLLLIAGSRNVLVDGEDFHKDVATIFYRQASDGQQIAGVQDAPLLEFSLNEIQSTDSTPTIPSNAVFLDIEPDQKGNFYVSGYYDQTPLDSLRTRALTGFILKLKWNKELKKLELVQNYKNFFGNNFSEFSQLLPRDISYQNQQIWVSALMHQNYLNSNTALGILFSFDETGKNISLVERTDIQHAQTQDLNQQSFDFYQFEEFRNDGKILLPYALRTSQQQSSTTTVAFRRQDFSDYIAFAEVTSEQNDSSNTESTEHGFLTLGLEGGTTQTLTSKIILNKDLLDLGAQESAIVENALELDNGYLLIGSIATSAQIKRYESTLWRFDLSGKLLREIRLSDYFSDTLIPTDHQFYGYTYDNQEQLTLWFQNILESQSQDIYSLKYNLKSEEISH